MALPLKSLLAVPKREGGFCTSINNILKSLITKGISFKDSQEKFEYYLDSAQYDLETAEAMFSTGRWLYVAFTCQQAIEKLVKGLYTFYIDDNYPRTHDIVQIVKRFEHKLLEPIAQERIKLFNDLSSFYINARYDFIKRKLSTLLNEQKAATILFQTKEVFSWLLTLK
jgi:HEPN domain-containing protein